jgi:hypothetical protein
MTGKKGGKIRMASTPVLNGPTPGTGYKKVKGKTQIKNGYLMGSSAKKVTKV